MENRDKVLADNRPTFDKKPVICKPWHKDIVDFKDEVKVVPIWIHLKHLDLKFWGNRSLGKIVSSIGEFIQADQATINRDKLQFARVQVEVALSQDLPDCVEFQDEHGILKTIKVGYEWKPIVCEHCKLLGHLAVDCRKKKGKKVWVAKINQTIQPVTRDSVVQDTGDGEEGFVQAINTVQIRQESISPVVVANSFQMLQDNGGNIEDTIDSGVTALDDGGGLPHDSNG
ncbi:uncharacterized protein [Spinacia oleracea]|uniref:DUF4283 domain-containing protein n=1 Tax=Spinacia oleracea TaxID=3562 RepID=A0ABM3QY22_SPIOL|nr:uncharacterized protein LOC130463227 [Spinacia oleracea]